MNVKSKAKSIGIVEGKNAPMVQVVFDVNGQDMKWLGSLADGRAREITADALIVLEFTSLNDICNGRGINFDKVVNLTIENEEYNGKVYPKIKWINEENKKEVLAASEAITKVRGIGLDALIMSRRVFNKAPTSAAPQEVLPF